MGFVAVVRSCSRGLCLTMLHKPSAVFFFQRKELPENQSREA